MCGLKWKARGWCDRFMTRLEERLRRSTYYSEKMVPSEECQDCSTVQIYDMQWE